MRKPFLALLPLLLLAACTTTPAGPATPALAGSTWRFVTIDGAPPVGEATLSFEAERLSTNAGCNRMGGTWRAEGGKLVTGPLISTKMFCEGKMEQERTVGDLLAGGPTLTVAGDRMTLTGGGHSAELERGR